MDFRSAEEFWDAWEKRMMLTQRRMETQDGSHWDDHTHAKIRDQFNEELQKGVNDIKNHSQTFIQRLNESEKKISEAKRQFNDFKTNWSQTADQMRRAGFSQKQINKESSRQYSRLQKEIDDAENAFANFSKQEEDFYKEKQSYLKKIKKLEKQALQKREQELDNSAKSEVAFHLTKGRSDRIERNGESMERFGRALYRVGGPFKKLGVYSRIAGAALKRFAPAIGAAIKMFELGMKQWDNRITRRENTYEYQSRAMGINTAQVRAENNMKLQALRGNNQILGYNQQFDLNANQQKYGLSEQYAQTYSQLGLEGNKIGNDAYVSANEMMASMPFDIKGAVYNAANAALDLSARSYMFNKNVGFAEQKLGYTAQKAQNEINKSQQDRDVDINLLKKNTEADFKLQNLQKDIQFKNSVNELKAWNNQKNYEEDKALMSTNLGSVGEGYFSYFGDTYHRSEQVDIEGQNKIQAQIYDKQLAQQEYATESAKVENERQAATTKYTNQLAYMQKQNEINLNEIRINAQQQYTNQLMESATKINQSWMKMAQNLNDEFLKMETASMKMGSNIGLNGNQLQKFSDYMGQMQIEVSKYGRNLEWMQKQQSNYQETTGRNKQFTERDFTTTATLGHLVGDDIVGQLNSGMEIFNTSVADSNAQFYEMYKSVSKMGLNGKKYGKDLVQNLKLAEKYNFKGGVKSLMEMSKWAQNVRFNTGSLDGMLDKVQKGGLEGIIKQSAELQVLGGNFAMGSDPLAMAYESYMDPEAYAKRMNSMIAGQGMFDSKTGNVSFGIASQQIMRQYAESTGQDYKDVLNQARQQVKVNQIKSSLNDNFTEEQQSLIANKANYNTETGQWEVNTLTGGVKNVSDLTSADINDLGPEESDDPQKTMVDLQTKMLEELASTYSLQDKINNAQTEMKSYLMGDGWSTLKDANDYIVKAMKNEFYNNITAYTKKVNDNIGTIARASSTFSNLFKEGNTPIDNVTSAITTGVTNLQTTISTCTSASANYLAQVMGSINPDIQIPEFNSTELQNAINKENRTDEKRPSNKSWLKGGLAVGGGALQGAAYGAIVGNAIPIIGTGAGAIVGALIGGGMSLYDYLSDDGLISTNGNLSKINDGLVIQNGISTRIDKNDQVLAAKEGGPLDRMLDMVQPRPMPYDSYVKENPYYGCNSNNGSVGNNNGEIKIAPISITINGSISVNGSSIDLTTQIQNDPNFQNALWGLISQEVSKKVGNTGKMIDPLYNRIKNTF